MRLRGNRGESVDMGALPLTMSLEAHDHDVEFRCSLGNRADTARETTDRNAIFRALRRIRGLTLPALNRLNARRVRKAGSRIRNNHEPLFQKSNAVRQCQRSRQTARPFCGDSPREFVIQRRATAKTPDRPPTSHESIESRTINSCVYAQLPSIITKAPRKSMSYRASDFSFFTDASGRTRTRRTEFTL